MITIQLTRLEQISARFGMRRYFRFLVKDYKRYPKVFKDNDDFRNLIGDLMSVRNVIVKLNKKP